MYRRLLTRLIPAFPIALRGASRLHAEPLISRVNLGLPSHRELMDLITHEGQWTRLRNVVTGLTHADHGFAHVSDPDLILIFLKLRQWGISLELEVGAVKEWGVTGRGTFLKEVDYWRRISRLGANITSLAMDEPLSACHNLLHEGIDYATRETVEFVVAARDELPDVAVGDIEPYPSIPIDEHRRWIDDLHRTLRKRTGRGLEFYRIDPDWAAFGAQSRVGWREVRDLERFCRERSISFSLIYWAANYPAENAAHADTSHSWYNGILEEGNSYREAGGRPDQYVIESWIGIPRESVPEDSILTFAGSALAFVDRFVNAATPR